MASKSKKSKQAGAKRQSRSSDAGDARKLATQAKTTMSRARKQLDAADRRVTAYIQRNPKKAAAIAAGIGAAVGAAVAAAMRTRK